MIFIRSGHFSQIRSLIGLAHWQICIENETHSCIFFTWLLSFPFITCILNLIMLMHFQLQLSDPDLPLVPNYRDLLLAAIDHGKMDIAERLVRIGVDCNRREKVWQLLNRLGWYHIFWPWINGNTLCNPERFSYSQDAEYQSDLNLEKPHFAAILLQDNSKNLKINVYQGVL